MDLLEVEVEEFPSMFSAGMMIHKSLFMVRLRLLFHYMFLSLNKCLIKLHFGSFGEKLIFETRFWTFQFLYIITGICASIYCFSTICFKNMLSDSRKEKRRRRDLWGREEEEMVWYEVFFFFVCVGGGGCWVLAFFW